MNSHRRTTLFLSARATATVVTLLYMESAGYALYRNGDYWPKSADGTTSVPVCFESTGEYAAQDEKRLRALVQESLAATWGRWTLIKFSGFINCGAGKPASPTLTIKLTETPYGHPQCLNR